MFARTVAGQDLALLWTREASQRLLAPVKAMEVVAPETTIEIVIVIATEVTNHHLRHRC